MGSVARLNQCPTANQRTPRLRGPILDGGMDLGARGQLVALRAAMRVLDPGWKKGSGHPQSLASALDRVV
jgi:hypothetical protein